MGAALGTRCGLPGDQPGRQRTAAAAMPGCRTAEAVLAVIRSPPPARMARGRRFGHSRLWRKKEFADMKAALMETEAEHLQKAFAGPLVWGRLAEPTVPESRSVALAVVAPALEVARRQDEEAESERQRKQAEKARREEERHRQAELKRRRAGQLAVFLSD